MVETITKQEPQAERSLMHRYNAAQQVGDQSYSVAGCPLENLSMRICEIAQ
jgi:hypothetical protein